MEFSVTVDTISPAERKLTVSIPDKMVLQELTRAYQNLQKDVRLRGFRPGKVPLSVLEARFGDQVGKEVVGRLVNLALDQAIQDHRLTPVSMPVVELPSIDDSGIRFVATVEIKPEVVAQGYTGLKLTREVFLMDEAAVEQELQKLRERKADLLVIEEDRPLEYGDHARVEYSASVNGTPVEKDQPKQGHVEVVEGSFLPGFAEQVTGMRRDERRAFSLELPNSNAQGQGSQVIDFDVKLLDIKRKVLPELDDEFARDLEHESLDALRANVREDLRKHLEESSTMKLHRDVANALGATNEVTLPTGMVTQQVELLAQEARRQAGQQVKGKLNVSEEERAALEPDARFRLQTSLLLESIARQESLSVSDDDLQKRLQEIADEVGRPVEAIRGLYMKNDAIGELKLKLLEEKALEFVVEKAEILTEEKPFAEHAHDHTH